MLRTNLSTRPFYNIRAVQAALGAFAVLVVIMSLVNVISLIRLTARQRSLGAQAVEDQTEAARLRREAVRIRGQVDAKELEVVSAAAREANAIIDMRAFSWSDLLAEFEVALPENVRVTAVQPRLEKDGPFAIAIRVEARRTGDLETFLDALEMTGAFHNVLTTDEQATSDGVIEAIVEAVYVQPTRNAPGENTAPTTGQRGAAGD